MRLTAVARKCFMVTVEGKAATLLSIAAGVVVCVGKSDLIVGYDLDTSLVLLKQLKLVSVRRSFATEANLPNEFGSALDCAWLENAKTVNVRARAKGKGFAGVMKRHGFRGLCSSHGVSLAHRSGGSIGARQDPGKV